MNRRLPIVTTLILTLLASNAWAVPPTEIPEPSTWALLGIGAVCMIAVQLRNRRK